MVSYRFSRKSGRGSLRDPSTDKGVALRRGGTVKGFNNLKVAMKLAIGFGITLSLTAVVGLVGWLGMKEARTNVNVIDDKVVTNLQNLDDFNGAARQVRIFEDQA